MLGTEENSKVHENRLRTGGRILVDALRLHGADRVFCVPGESYLDVLDALHDTPEIDLVVAKHEGGAASMAEADGKLTGRPGICMVTRGPGATHASIGVHIAQQDSTPMILFIGQIARGQTGRDVFQEVDYVSMFGQMAKWVVEIGEAARIPEILARAFHAAVSGRPGPVVIALPEDMLAETAAVADCPAVMPAPVGIPDAVIAQIQALLNQARSPMVVVGGPDWSEQARHDLALFARHWHLPVACSFRRQDVLNNTDPNYVGHLSLGMSPVLGRRLKDADVVLALGARLTDTATADYTLIEPPRPAQRLIHVHADVGEIGRVFQADLAVPAPVSAVLARLAATRPVSAVPGWAGATAMARREHEAFAAGDALATPVDGVDLTQVVKHLSEALPDDAIVTNGAGNYSVWLHRFYQYRGGRTQLAPVCGSMGYGLPAAIAASLRHPGREVVCVAGDGCFLMYPQELATAVEYGARVIVIIANNGIYGTIRMHQEKRYPNRISGTRLQGPDYVALGKSFGGHAERVVRTADFSAALQRARGAAGVSLIELATDPLQLTPSMRLPGTTSHAGDRAAALASEFADAAK